MLVQLLAVLVGIFIRKGELTSSTPPACLLLGKYSRCNFSKWNFQEFRTGLAVLAWGGPLSDFNETVTEAQTAGG